MVVPSLPGQLVSKQNYYTLIVCVLVRKINYTTNIHINMFQIYPTEVINHPTFYFYN